MNSTNQIPIKEVVQNGVIYYVSGYVKGVDEIFILFSIEDNLQNYA